MITCILEKNLENGKMMINKWWFTPKEKIEETKELYPEAVIIDSIKVPESFYKDSSNYFYEGNELINFYI